jgi:uncharacterized protein YjbI with pentapeptide repeats
VECNLSLAKFLNTKLRKTEFSGCKLQGNNFSQADSFALDIGFRKCIISNCIFSELKLRKTSFTECELDDCDFYKSDLTEADFTLASLQGTVFENTILEKAIFTDARNYAINPLKNNIKKARFSMPEAISLIESLGIIIR